MHVFVETNWVFACFSPRHRRVPAAERLLAFAANGVLQLHVPTVAITEGARVIRTKCQPRGGDVVAWYEFACANQLIPSDLAQHVRGFLADHAKSVHEDLNRLDEDLRNLRQRPGVDVFPLSETALEQMALFQVELKPYDEAILAAVLTRAGEIRHQEPEARIVFCTLDSDLIPKENSAIAELYETAGISVRQDFYVGYR